MKAGNWKNAKTLFESGIRSSPNHGALWHAYASMEARRGNFAAGRSLFAEGVKKAPNHVPLYQGWASLELRAEDYPAAKALITHALTRDKRNGSGWLIAAEIEERQGNHGLVNLLLRRGIECAPSCVGLYQKLGNSLMAKGRINDAREVLEQGIARDPLHAPLYHSLAELEASVFNLEGLSKLNKQATKLFNSNAMFPAPSSTAAFAAKIKSDRSRSIPHGVAALAQRIVDDSDEGGIINDSLDPDSVLDSLIMEGTFEEALLSIDVPVQ
jgi:tetratricopeptide (TPR) repeat protein